MKGPPARCEANRAGVNSPFSFSAFTWSKRSADQVKAPLGPAPAFLRSVAVSVSQVRVLAATYAPIPAPSVLVAIGWGVGPFQRVVLALGEGF